VPIPVTVYTWPPGGGQIAINRLDWTMYDVPAVGSRYWHGRDPYKVRGVDENTDPVTVHLEHDDAWVAELHDALPDGYWLDGGRSDTDGRWHFQIVQDGVDRPIGMYIGDTLDDALDQAVVAAQQRAAAG
jgi:hypothetical protein